MKKYMTIFPSCTSHIKSRDKALQETNKVQAKLEKYEDKEHTASNSVKIEQVRPRCFLLSNLFNCKCTTSCLTCIYTVITLL